MLGEHPNAYVQCVVVLCVVFSALLFCFAIRCLLSWSFYEPVLLGSLTL